MLSEGRLRRGRSLDVSLTSDRLATVVPIRLHAVALRLLARRTGSGWKRAGETPMSEFEVAYHKRWLGMLEPIEGLVVSIPVLVEAECMEKLDPELSRQLADEANQLTRVIGKAEAGQSRREIVSLDDFLGRVLGLTPELFARGAELPADLELYVPEGGETIRPTLALKKRATDTAADASEGVPDVSTPQSRAGESFVLLVSDLPGLNLEAVDRREGCWAHPPLAKFDRLLRATRVPCWRSPETAGI